MEWPEKNLNYPTKSDMCDQAQRHGGGESISVPCPLKR